MNIIHLISSIDRGGAESHLASLAKEQKKFDKVTIIYFKGNDYWKSKLEKDKINVIKINLTTRFAILQLFELLFKINKIINKLNPDILHSHLTMMELVGAILTKFNKQKFKFIVTKHLDSFFLEGSKGKKKGLIKGIFIDNFIINTSHKTICISNQVKKFFKNKTNSPKKKFKLIYYGFDFSKFKKNKDFNQSNEFKILNKINKKNLILCCVARHVNQKSLDFLLEGFSKYLKINSHCNLIMVGSGPETNNLKLLSKKLNINKNITWIRFTDNIRDILDLSDVFVLTSEYEGLGLVLLEAMAAKIPIIATNISAIPEVVRNNYNGLLIEHLNHNDLVKKINLIQDKKRIKKFNFNSKKLLEKKFSLNSMIKKTKKIYNEKY